MPTIASGPVPARVTVVLNGRGVVLKADADKIVEQWPDEIKSKNYVLFVGDRSNLHGPNLEAFVVESVACDFPPRRLAFSDWLSSYTDDIRAVRTFCQKHQILADLKTAIRLITQSFPRTQNVRIALRGDPEGDGEWLVIQFDAAGDVGHVLGAYAKLKKEWVSLIQGRGLGMIRFLYNIT